ncbi:proline dehydrogenase family protein [Paenactinomyces guangxiensis]|uniref:proline dehydrogenase n=1 Tax=Paenactinomyces guangxiensis TaxID=1490290 RepID=A0A7W1WT20_9BACL|nr:proline dehydrogenase family protein [Paenactinomyces guangxiensis]MBA4495525.1 proline dehydrogenase family protein [Paenactinomyces guangxiensis]MBH8592783.1 proline dehydrogenase family protein [Paenactinomyces guangxiensis]
MSLSRKAVLTLAGNRAVTSLVSKYGMKWGAARFVAGETLDQTIETVKKINADGLLVTLDHLGESVSNREEALEATQAALDIFDAIEESGVISNVSVKLTQLGLDIDKDFCLENMDRITAKAKEKNNFVRIDMEDSPRLQVTIDIFNTLVDKYGKEHIGLVIQSYLYRSENDVLALGKKNVNLRIVKGAYKEPAEVAFPNKKDVDDNYVKLVKLHLQNGCYTAIATHDETIINLLKDWLKEKQIPDNLYEFQMLYGVRNELQRQLVREGYKVRVYTPYGKDWYPYFTRRIAERPANALFVLKSFFQK